MPKEHVVKSGECLALIAHQYSVADPMRIWNDAANADLKKSRGNPDLLFPGDRLSIPDAKPKSLSLPTGSVHQVTVKTAKKKVRVRLLDMEGKPYQNADCELKAGSKTLPKKTDGDGKVEFEVPASVRAAELKLGAQRWTLNVGALNPMSGVADDLSGLQARLQNLGYEVGAIDGKTSDALHAAIEAFQRDHQLTVDGQVSDALVAKVKDLYGC